MFWLEPMLLLLLLGWLAGEGRAAGPVRFIHASVEQGLSQNTVQAILQDHVGFMWFGTEEGLNRYDGYAFAVFKHDPQDSGSLADDVVSALCEDRQHRLWVGTEHGLCRFDRRTERFAAVPAISDRVTAIAEGADGVLWVATGGSGLYVLRPNSETFASYLPAAKDPGSLASYLISALCVDRHGRLWIGTINAGLEQFDAETGPFGRFLHHRHDAADPNSLAHDEIWGLAEAANGDLWVATYGGGLDVLDHATGVFRHYRPRAGDPHALPTALITNVFVDRAGGIWVGTDGSGLLRYDPSVDGFAAFTHSPTEPASLANNVVRALYEDAKDQLWIGTFQGGVDQLKPNRREFAYFTHDPAAPAGLNGAAVSAFLEDADGSIWLGTEEGWLNRFDRTAGIFTHYRYPSANPGGTAILALHRDGRGRLWVGSYRGGLARFDPASANFTVFKHEAGDPRSLANDEVWTIAGDAEGALWLGTNAGLDRFDPDRGEVSAHVVVAETDGAGFADVRALLVDRGGNLWVGGFGGLALRKTGADRFVRFLHDEHDPRSLSNDAVSSLHEDSQGRLWVGTFGGGLNCLDPAQRAFTRYQSFPSNVINSIQEDGAQRIWVSTNHGLSRLTPATGALENFDLTNGLQSLQFHLGAGLRLQRDRLLFGSADGFYEVDPGGIAPNPHAPAVVLTALRVFNQPVRLPAALSTLNALTLASSDNVFSLEFAALDFTFPRRNRYAYQLEGFSDRWIDMGEKREITFTNLDPGEYVFRVKASNSDGVWHAASTAALRLTIRPPVWGTWWFRGGTGAVLVLGTIAAYRVRVRRLTREIAERRRAAEALRASEDRYRRFFVEDLAGAFIADPQGRLLACNPAFARIFGFAAPEAALGSDLFGLCADPAVGTELRNRLHVEHRLQDCELEMLRCNGKPVHLVANLVASFAGTAGPVEITGYVFDMTERKQLEAQLLQSQKMEAVGQLAGGVAHDFNNLLTAIISYSELTLDGHRLDEQARANLGEIRNAGQRAATLTRQLLAFSRRQTLQPTVLDLNALVTHVDTMLRRLIGEDIDLRLVLAPGLGRVRADHGQIEQVLLNLVVNARDAMPRGGQLGIETANVTLDEHFARQHGDLRPGPYVRLAVSDTGSGMDAEIQSHLFEPFFTTKGVGKGTGLGLSTAYGIVKQSEGHIAVYTEPGVGSTFKVYLPQVDAPLPSAAGVAPRARTLGTETILVVEDNEAVRRAACHVLRQHGYAVVEATSGADALALQARHPGSIDLLLTDVIMPDMNGRELAERLLTVRPATRVLFMSGYTDDAISRHGGLGAECVFIEKPFTPERLNEKVREALGRPSGAANG